MNHTPDAWETSAFLTELLAQEPSWLPPVSSWELFREADGRYSLSGAIVPGPRTAANILRDAANANDGSYEEGVASYARFTLDRHDVTLYHLPPPASRPAPSCTTCTASFGEPGTPFVWIGTSPKPICIPCRDRMHEDFLAAGAPSTPAGATELTSTTR